MSATFGCPHCDKQYPNNPSLIGRKVRCSSCKKVFQLQGDGKAIKIEIMEQDQSAPKKGPSTTRASVTQQLTKRQKTSVKKSITKRIEKGRSALRDAAKEAIASQIGEGESADQVKKDSKKSSAVRPAREIEVHLSGADTLPGKLKKLFLIVVALIVLVILYALLFVEPTPERAALNAYAGTVDPEQIAYPHRMNEYRSRMWLYSRDGTDLPPIVVNADKSEIVDIGEINWSNLIDICQKHVGGMSLMPNFGIMVNSDKQAMVEDMWENYQHKYDVPKFFKLLNQKNIKFHYCSKIPELLSQNGLSDREVYIVSLLLAGTRNKQGSACLDFGIISSLTADFAHVYEFHGKRGMELVERTNEYAISMTGPFCGIIIGFKGIQDRADEWRVLDMRLDESMSVYYDKKHNPLKILSNKARNALLNAFENPNYKEKTTEEEGQP